MRFSFSYAEPNLNNGRAKKVHAVAQQDCSSESDTDFVFSVKSVADNHNEHNDCCVPVYINGVKGKVYVDSCATANIMDEHQFRLIQERSCTPISLVPTTTVVYAYAQKQPIQLAGEFDAKIVSTTTGK